MDLGEKWEWKGRKLACRVRVETGNPGGDDLRARFVELAGMELEEMNKISDTLDSLKNTKRKKEIEKKGVHIDHKADKKFNEVLSRKHILGATQLAITTIEEEEFKAATTVTQKNIKKQFARLPVCPPPRVLLEIQRERSKPPTVVESEEHEAKRAKLEKKLEKQRIKRMQAMKATDGDSDKNNQFAMSQTMTADALSNTFSSNNQQKAGDLFGTNGDYMGSMLYMSRMAGGLEKSDRAIRNEKTIRMLDGPKEDNIEENKKEDDEGESPEGEIDDTQSQGSNNVGTDASAKLYCAASLCNWSRNPANNKRLAVEGGVRAIMQLMQEPSVRIRRFAAAAFRFMSEDPILSIAMIEDGAVSAISDVVKVPIDDFSATNLAVALVNLTRINGREASLVEGSMVLCLHQLIINCPELASLCARGLYNLTCVDGMYPLMERLIRTIIGISSSNVASVKHICAAALCNVSDLKLMRPRLIEEGIIAVLGTIARHSPTRTRRVCAVILQNLSATKSCRVEMVVRSSVHVAHGLSSDKDPIILRCVGLTLARLSTESANSTRIVQEYGVAALINIAMKFSAVTGISQPVSTALQLLSQQESTRIAVVQEGCVTSLAQLLHTSTDPFTLQNSLFALSNLLTEPENHLPIVQQGLILTLVSIASNGDEILRDLCALAFFNMSCSDDSHKHIVNAGAIDSLIKLSQQKQALTKQRCAAALCNVSAYESGMARMVADGIIPALVNLLSEDDVTIHYACAALCRLCTSQENSEMISKSGGVPSLVEGTLKGDFTTKVFCGAVLSALSYYEVCRAPLCNLGAIAALKSLASLNDDLSHQRCLVAFANISCEESVRSHMVEEGVVSITASLIGNSYQEKNYICCAKALCNLACAESTRLQVAQQGGVHALLMVSMVHSVDRQTKLLCVLALYNLLDSNTVDFMVGEGITTSVANLAKMGDSRILNLCAKIFNYLTRFEQAMEKLAERVSLTYSAISNMTMDDNQDTKMAGSRTIANLVLCPNKTVSNAMIEGGAFEPLDKGCIQDDTSASTQCIAALFSACSSSEFLAMIAKQGITKSLLEVANQGRHTDEQVYIFICKMLAMLTVDTASRPFLRNADIAVPLMQYINKNENIECGRWLSIAMQHICNGYDDHAQFMSFGAVGAVLKLFSLNDKLGVISASNAETVRLLIHGNNSDDYIFEFACSNIMDALYRSTVEGIANKNPAAVYNVGVVLFELANHSNRTRLEISLPSTVEIMKLLIAQKQCDDLSIATMFQLYHDSKSRAVFSNVDIALGMLAVLKRDPVADTLYNTISAFWALTKLPSSRDYLEDPVNLNDYVLQLAKTENPKLKANVARLLKNLQSDINEAIEEGAVAALIAISLEGKAQRQKAGNEMRAPEITPLGKEMTLDCGVESFDGSPFLFHIDKELGIGGSAGKGPGLPEPPTMQTSVKAYAQFSIDELDGSEVEGKAKMSFAKMQIPTEVRTQHLFVDADFDIKEDDASIADETPSLGMDSVVAGGALDNSQYMENRKLTSGDDKSVTKEGVSVESNSDPMSGIAAEESKEGSTHSKGGGGSNSHKGGNTHGAGGGTNSSTGGHKKKSGGAPFKPTSPTNKKSSKTAKETSNSHNAEVEKNNKEMGAKAAQLGLYK